MERLTIINYVDTDGEDVPMDALQQEKRQKIAEIVQDRMMHMAGYKRKNTA